MENKFMLDTFTLTKKGGKTMKVYGNVINRLMENQPEMPEIKVGMDITMYYWSDRKCWYVTDVIDQKRIKVAQYEVIADHDKAGGMGHQDWLYFKTPKEASDYLKAHGFDGYNSDRAPREDTWVYRYNKWMKEVIYTPDEVLSNKRCFTDKQIANAEKGKPVKGYFNLDGKIRFGVRNYYYDWEF